MPLRLDRWEAVPYSAFESQTGVTPTPGLTPGVPYVALPTGGFAALGETRVIDPTTGTRLLTLDAFALGDVTTPQERGTASSYGGATYWGACQDVSTGRNYQWALFLIGSGAPSTTQHHLRVWEIMLAEDGRSFTRGEPYIRAAPTGWTVQPRRPDASMVDGLFHLILRDPTAASTDWKIFRFAQGAYDPQDATTITFSNGASVESYAVFADADDLWAITTQGYWWRREDWRGAADANVGGSVDFTNSQATRKDYTISRTFYQDIPAQVGIFAQNGAAVDLLALVRNRKESVSSLDDVYDFYRVDLDDESKSSAVEFGDATSGSNILVLNAHSLSIWDGRAIAETPGPGVSPAPMLAPLLAEPPMQAIGDFCMVQLRGQETRGARVVRGAGDEIFTQAGRSSYHCRIRNLPDAFLRGETIRFTHDGRTYVVSDYRQEARGQVFGRFEIEIAETN